jgi:hypothetical protein
MSSPEGLRRTFGLLSDQGVRELSLALNALTMSREALMSRFADPRRDYDAECGHPETFSAEQYRELFDRDPVARRVVQCWPRESWRVLPSVYEDEGADTLTPFEQAWRALPAMLSGGSRLRDEACSTVFRELALADELSGVGRYGALMLGLDDGLPLDQPAVLRKGQRLLYLRSFPESLADVSRLESDPNSSRYGEPLQYLITFQDPRLVEGAAIGATGSSMSVHWTRVIHLCDNGESNRAFGTPRMQPVLNRLLDLKKLYGGSAEMYWRGAFPGLSIETHPSLGGDVKIDAVSMREQVDNYQNKLSRYLALRGMAAKSLAPQVVDPTPQIMAHLQAICILLEFPLRVFMGSEQGRLAADQDSRNHLARVRGRQNGYLTPRVVAPFVDRLVMLGVLPEPAQYSVWWPDVESASELEKADVAAKLCAAVAAYIQAGGEALIPPLDFFTRVLGWDDAEALEVLEHAVESAEDDEPLSPEGLSPTTREVSRSSVGEAVGDLPRLLDQDGNTYKPGTGDMRAKSIRAGLRAMSSRMSPRKADRNTSKGVAQGNGRPQ